MANKTLNLPDSDFIKKHVLDSLNVYWIKNKELLSSLPISKIKNPKISLPLILTEIPLPEWGRNCGVDGVLLVPIEACFSEKNNWEKVDWFLAAFLLFEAWHERLWEKEHSPIHSYSFKLKNWDCRVWDYAWANRIALFLRCWSAHILSRSENELFGNIPNANIVITHDVDALRKTMALRIKQTLFIIFNSLRNLFRGDLSTSSYLLKKACVFFFGKGNDWSFEDIINLEKEASITGIYNLYADVRRPNFVRWLFDPKYSVFDKVGKEMVAKLVGNDMDIGLHPSYDSWNSEEIIQKQKKVLEKAINRKVVICRQHWLRFSWECTWLLQQNTGLELDLTLMFNDRPGFRSAMASEWRPYNTNSGLAHKIKILPTIFMDSHFYDYTQMTREERQANIKRWLSEVFFVGGKVAILWHPHTLTDDYGWRDGFIDVLNMLKEANASA